MTSRILLLVDLLTEIYGNVTVAGTFTKIVTVDAFKVSYTPYYKMHNTAFPLIRAGPQVNFT